MHKYMLQPVDWSDPVDRGNWESTLSKSFNSRVKFNCNIFAKEFYYPPGQFYLDGFKETEIGYPIWRSSICSKVNDRNTAYYEFIILFFLHLSVVLWLFIFYVSVLKYKYIPE